MGVANRIGRVVPDQVLVADVHPTAEPDAAVDDEQLLVRAQVEERHPPRQRRMHEAPDANLPAAQSAEGRWKKISAPDAVEEDTHFDAALVRVRKGVHEHAPRGVATHDVGR